MRNNTSHTPANPSRHPLVMALLTMALLLIGVALWASNAQKHNTGPHALAANAQHVWLGVNDEIWRLSPEGRLQARWPMAEHGFPHGVAQIRWMSPTQASALGWDQPDLMVSSRFSGRLDRLSADGQHLGHIPLQWPADLAHAGQDATYFAVSDTGKIALTTGGGHTVALFDRSGRFLVQSPAGSFAFTNGIFWGNDGFWATDTNRSELVLLDTDTLRVKQRTPLQPGHFLGDLVASPRGLATVTQLRNGMRHGHVSSVMPDGRTVDWSMPKGTDLLVPRSLLWHGGRLLVSDGETGSVLVAPHPHTAPTAWGDAKVQALLKQFKTAKDQAQRMHQLSLGGGVALLLAALLLLRRRQQHAEQSLLSHMQQHIHPKLLAKVRRHPHAAARKAFGRAMLLFQLPAMVVLLVLTAALFATGSVLMRALPLNPIVSHLPWVLTVPVVLLLARLQLRHLHKLAAKPELEEHFNAHAYRNLLKPELFWAIQQPDEVVLESLCGVTQHKPQRASQWWVLTDQRLLIWQGPMRKDSASLKLLGEWPLSDIVRQGVRPPKIRRWAAWLRADVGLTVGIKFRQGRTHTCSMPAVPAAKRLLHTLKQMRADAHSSPSQTTPTRVPATKAKPSTSRVSAAPSAALAWLLTPGSGHALQRRQSVALPLFVAAGLVGVAWLLPFAWTWWHQSADIPLLTGLHILLVAVLLHGLSSWDAWHQLSATLVP